jgi:hypothetical protein
MRSLGEQGVQFVWIKFELAILNVLKHCGNSKSYMTFEHIQVHGMNPLKYKGQLCLIAQRNMITEQKLAPNGRNSAQNEGNELKASPQREIYCEKRLWVVETGLAQPPCERRRAVAAALSRKSRGGPNPRSVTTARVRENRVEEWRGRPVTST